MAVRRHKEAIHSGHFMVSNFEADEQDEDDIVGIPVPSEDSTAEKVPDAAVQQKVQNQFKSLVNLLNTSTVPNLQQNNSLMIDVSLTKLFQCMSIAYRQKLTSPKWNRFLGMKLRWKDKFRLNNVIWRCWHMQFIKGHRKLVCAFANPMELDNHNKTEAGALLEGKYWKRKMNVILSEYQKWRIFYKNQHSWPTVGKENFSDMNNPNIETAIRTGKDDIELESLMTDHDFFVDALFNSLGSQSVQFQDSERLLTSSEFLQPSLNNLQPNIEDLMDLDPMAPLQDWLSSKLPEAVEECSQLTPHQSYQNIKDIEVHEARYHPFSHASLRDVSGYSSGKAATVTSGLATDSYLASASAQQKPPEFGHGDSQPSTSTLSPYPEYSKKKAPLPGKKLWAIQQCQQQQQYSSDTCPRPAPHVSHDACPRPTSHVSVIQQPVYPQRSVIATNPASMGKQPAPATYTPSYLTPRCPPHIGAGAGGGGGGGGGGATVSVKHELVDHAVTNKSELVQLLKNNQRRPQPEEGCGPGPAPATGRHTRSRKHKSEEAAEDLSNISGKLKRVVAAAPASASSIPPPPPGGMPQPEASLAIGPGYSIVPEDAKLSSAEQKRRCTIKNGFELLRALLPALAQTPSVKISKAALLAKGAEHVLQLSREGESLGGEVDQLRSSVQELNADIAKYQLQLPTAGSAKVRSGGEPGQLQTLFERHVAACTMQNWKYWVFSKLMQPLLDSFDRTVSGASMEDLARTSASWLDQHAALVQLRPIVLNSLKDLSVNTEILSEPHKMPQEALNHVQNIIAPKKEFPTRTSASAGGGAAAGEGQGYHAS